uniref:Neuropeptide receptor 4 n=1 Tax=Ascaris suum TaxID=6253 RepID=A0A2S1X9K6_ASCSU|nr:neuropeptide receptor 4 [Ascaris suum]
MSNESCLDMNDELWRFRNDLTTQPAVMAIFALLYATIIVLGIFGNLCVILAIARTRSLQTVPNLFIFSLSCSDVVVCCISATITPITAFKKEWLFGVTLCSIAPFIAGISLCFSTFTLTAISVDRFLLICFPMKNALTKSHALILIAGICAMAACLSAPIMFKQRLQTFENFCGKFCTEDWGMDQSGRRIYGAIMVGVQFVVPLTIIVICYTAIAVKLGQGMLIKGKNSNYDWQVQMTDQQRAAVRRRQRTNRMLICMVVAFSASWLWSVLFNVLRDYDRLPDWMKIQEYLYGIATHCIAMTSTVWNPLLYAVLNPQLRAAFIRLMPSCLQSTTTFERCDQLTRNGTLLETGDRRDSTKMQQNVRQAISSAPGQYGATEVRAIWSDVTELSCASCGS